MAETAPKTKTIAEPYYNGSNAMVKPSSIHGLGYSIIFQYYILNNSFFQGVFALKTLEPRTRICDIPGTYFHNPTMKDNHRNYVWDCRGEDFKIDSTAFRNVVFGVEGFGHFINTCVVKGTANAQYVYCADG